MLTRVVGLFVPISACCRPAPECLAPHELHLPPTCTSWRNDKRLSRSGAFGRPERRTWPPRAARAGAGTCGPAPTPPHPTAWSTTLRTCAGGRGRRWHPLAETDGRWRVPLCCAPPSAHVPAAITLGPRHSATRPASAPRQSDPSRGHAPLIRPAASAAAWVTPPREPRSSHSAARSATRTTRRASSQRDLRSMPVQGAVAAARARR